MPLQLYEKERILDACFTVFACHGYANTSTAMLAEAAGISKALIFHHFKSKKKLYFSVLKRCIKKMATEVGDDSQSDYQDFFEAWGKRGLLKFDYLKKNPNVNKVLFEAFYATPNEIKADLNQFMIDIEEKYGSTDRNKWRNQLFDKVPLREGVDREEALELIQVTMDYFEKVYLSQLTNEGELDEALWQNIFDKRINFLNMIRYGIEEKRD